MPESDSVTPKIVKETVVINVSVVIFSRVMF